MQEISCVLCEASNSEAVAHDNGFTGRQCSNCGLIFVSPRPSREEMAKVYEEGEAYLSPESFVRGPESLSGLARAREDVKRVRRHVTGGSLLEIGPGRGTFLVAARRAGFDVFGVELNPVQAEFIRKQHGISCVESLDAASTLNGGQFDVIYHRDVLSHFYDPHEEFARLRDLLKPGGYQIFETGNLGDVDHRYLKLVKSFQYPDHLFFYGEKSLKRLFDQTGFDHVHTYRYSILPERLVRSALVRLKRGSTAPPSSPLPSTSSPTNGQGPAGQIARQGLDMFYHGLHLTLGRIPVKPDVPQTLIVVARKK